MTRARIPGALALLTAAGLALSGCAGTAADTAAADADAAATEITVTHAQGETVVPVQPETVVTFDLASLDTLDTLGVEVAGVPKSNLPGYLDQYADDATADVGTLFEPDYEAVNALEPDLIIVANRSAEALPELSKIAPTIDLTLDWEHYLDSFRGNVETLAEIYALEDDADAALAELDEKIADTKAAAEDAGTALILLTSGGELTAFGPGSRFGWLHDELGVTPAIADVEAATHGDPVSNEFVLQTNPDRLFVVDRDAATGEGTQTAEQILDNEVIAQTTAWSGGDVTYLDPEPWYIVMSGLTAVDTMVGQVQAALS